MSGLRSTTDIEAVWREIDWRLQTRQIEIDEAVSELVSKGLVRKALTIADAPDDPLREQVWMLEVGRDVLVPGPRVMIAYPYGRGRLYGCHGRIYRPVTDRIMRDTGMFTFEFADGEMPPTEGG